MERKVTKVASLCQLEPDELQQLSSRIASRFAQQRLPGIAKLELFLTENCTLRCDYCFVSSKNPERRMPWETASKAVDFLVSNSRDFNDLSITLFGGEPLLEFPLLKRTVEYAEEQARSAGKQIRFAVTINGTIMSEEIALFGRDHRFNYLLSMDGNRAAHDRHRKRPNGKGSWDLVTGENFRLLKSIQKWLGARVTISPDTVQRLSASVEDLFEKGINQFLLAPNMDIPWSRRCLNLYAAEMSSVADFYMRRKAEGAPIRIVDFEETLGKRREKYRSLWGCDAGKTRVAVSTNGEIYPCARFVSSWPGMERYKLGTLHTGLSEIAPRMELLDCGGQKRPKCASCDVGDLCPGGCPAVNLHLSGSIFEVSDLDCLTTRMMLDILPRIHGADKAMT